MFLFEIGLLVVTCIYLQIVIWRDKRDRRRKKRKPPWFNLRNFTGDPLYTWLCLRYCPEIEPEIKFDTKKVIVLADYKPKRLRNMEKLPALQQQF